MKRILIGSFVGVGLLLIGLTLILISVKDMQAEPIVNSEKPPYREYNSGVQIKVLVNGYPLTEYFGRGKRYVEAVEGAEYELQITNSRPERVAVAISVDGLNTIDAEHSSAWDASKWVIGPYQTITINGWQMSSSRARRFYFTSEQDSYGAKLGKTSNLGTISAVFFRERRPVSVVTPRRKSERIEQERRNSDQPAAPSSASGSSASKDAESSAMSAPKEEYAATGIGRSIDNNVNWVSLDLDPRPIAQSSIRYEYRPTLIKLGIIPRYYPTPDPLQRREKAHGFENRTYCPEP
jgi:hypothetical protein